MAITKILTILIFIFGIVTSYPHPRTDNYLNLNISIKPQRNYRLPNSTIPIHYDVRLIPHIVEGNFTFDGEIKAIFEVLESTAKVALNSKKLDIDESSTVLQYEDGTFIKPLDHNLDDETDILTLRFDKSLTLGIYTLDMKFKGILDNDLYGFYRSSYINDKGEEVWLAATHFQPTSARCAFPCWDEPALKATFNISIKHYSNYTALSNMPSYTESIEDENDEKVWTHFEQTPVMSTNILAFVVADYGRVSNEDGTISVWCKKHALDNVKYFLEHAIKAQTVLEQFLNSTIRVPKIDYVAIPDYSSAATENWGLVAYSERYLLYNDSVDSPQAKEAAILTGTHELTHMWFGNLVSPSWWRYLWLSEGFAAYFKYYITDKMYKDWRMSDLFPLRSTRMYAFSSDTFDSVTSLNEDVGSLSDIRHKFSAVTYHKAPGLLRMLMHILGEDVFHVGLIKYLDTYQYKAVTPDDLWNVFQDVLDESRTNHNGIDVKEVMDTWTEQRGYPLVTIIRDYNTGETKVTQESYKNYAKYEISTTDEKKWWIPLNFATRTSTDFSSTLATNWLKPQDEETLISGIDVDDWLIANIQQTGFYRVNYDPVNWRRIAKYLNSDNYTKIHVLNRAQILDDVFSLMISQRLNYSIFLELTNYLEREIDYVPWYLVFQMMSNMKIYFSVPIFADILKSHVLKLMSNLIESVGFEARPDDAYIDRHARSDIRHWACFLDHAECRTKAFANLIKYLEDPALNKVLPTEKEWTFCMGLRKANESIWNEVFDLYREKSSWYLLDYLGCTENSTILNMFLETIIMKDSPVQEDYKINAILSAYRNNPFNQDAILDFIIENKEKITSNLQDTDDLYVRIIYNVNSLVQYKKVSQHLKSDSLIRNAIIEQRQTFLMNFEKELTNIRNRLEDWKRSENNNTLTDDTLIDNWTI